MRSFPLPLLGLLLPLAGFASEPEFCHFSRAAIPPSEARLSALARIREFRCDYQLPRTTHGTLLIAELYRNGVCEKRFRLSFAVYDESRKTNIGMISLGWHEDDRKLVSVHDNGDFYSPWTAVAQLPEFQPLDAYYFAESAPEIRKSDPPYETDKPTYLFPVIGLCGTRDRKIIYPKNANSETFLKACQKAGAEYAVIVYLYFSSAGETPRMSFAPGAN